MDKWTLSGSNCGNQYHDDILTERVSEQDVAVSFGLEIIQDYFHVPNCRQEFSGLNQ